MSAITAASATGVLVVDSSLKAFSIDEARGAAATATLVLVNVVAAAIAFWAAGVLQHPSDDRLPGARRQHAVQALVALACFVIPYLVLAVQAFVGWRRTVVGADDLVADPRDAEQALLEHRHAVAAWRQRVDEHDAAQKRERESKRGWRIVPVSQVVPTACVFGGTARSWAAALTTLGASLLGSDHRVAIVDLSGRLTVDELCDGCRQVGIPAIEAAFPDSSTADALVADLSWDELGAVLAEMRHAAQQDPHVAQDAREEDRELIRRVGECLVDRVSIARLRSALLVLHDDEGGRDGAAGVDAPERSRLLALRAKLGQEDGGDALASARRVELALRGVEPSLQAASRDGDHARTDGLRRLAGVRPSLLAVGIDKRDDQLRNERCATLLFELIARRARLQRLPIEALVILGADRIQAGKLESMLAATEDCGIKTFLFFEHIRGDSIGLVGAHGGAAAFLKLGNHLQAREAVDYIGPEHKLVIAEQTISASESLAQTRGWEQGRSSSATLAFPPAASVGLSQTSSRSYGETFGHSRGYTRSVQRVSESMIEPQVLMGLPLTEMIYVEVLPGGERRARNVDCYPEAGRSLRPGPGSASGTEP